MAMPDKVVERDIADEMKQSYIDYAMSVIVSRALPDVRDGLKPVQRRICFTMSENGNTPDKPHKKSVRTVGDVLGRYHPHGDSAVYDALVRLAQDFSMRYPLIDGHGNFGCFTGDTRILLADGTRPTLAELAELGPEGRFYVYAVNHQGRIVIAEGRNARVTRRNTELVEVVLDNGARIRCTPDHRFMLRDGDYKQAKDLTPEDSLMAGYFDMAAVRPGTNDYLRIKQPNGEWTFVHHLADEFNARIGRARRLDRGYVRHHRDFKRFNNSPENIERLTFKEHNRVHAEHLKTLWARPDFQESQRLGVRLYHELNPEMTEMRRRFVIQNKSEVFRAINGKRVARSLKRLYAENPHLRKTISERMKALWRDPEFRARMAQALAGIEKRPLTPEEKRRVSEIISEKSRLMWSEPGKRAAIRQAMVEAMARPEIREKLSSKSRELWNDPSYRNKFPEGHHGAMAIRLWSDPATKERHRRKIERQWEDPRFCEQQRMGVSRANRERIEKDPDMMKQLTEKATESLRRKWAEPAYRRRVMRTRVAGYVTRLLLEVGPDGLTPEAFDQDRPINIPRFEKALTYFEDLGDLVHEARTYNHRVVAVRWLDERADVYDITVDEYHNFLLADGVFVHNSVDGDPAAAMRYCVTGDTLVVTDRGLLRMDRISEHGDEDVAVRVLSMHGNVNTASKWFDCGLFPTRRVTTRRGYEVTGTTNHPLLVCVPGDDGRTALVWKTIEEIVPGDRLVLDRNETFWPEEPVDLRAFHPSLPPGSRVKQHALPTHLDEDFAFLLGALMAEGTFRKEVVEFTNTPGDFAEAFQAAWARVFPTCRLHTFLRKPVSYGKKPFWQIQVVSRQVIAFLANLGLAGKSGDRRIPEVVLRSPQAVVAAFLRGFYEGDGAVERSGRSLLRIGLCAKNRTLLREVQTLMLRFGIVSTLNEERSRGTHRLLILGQGNLERFTDKIGFVSAVKRKALINALVMHSGGGLSRTDFVPFLADFVRANAARGQREWLAKHNFDRPERLTATLPRLAQVLPSQDMVWIEQIARANYLFDQVESVEDAGWQRVYSVRVDSYCHSFVANGFINHNTEARLAPIAMQLLADLDKETVDFQPNFDGEYEEPVVLPARFPNLLVNGSSGIAVGMATNIPPHNLGEVIDGVIAMIDNPQVGTRDLMKHIKGPDFPTGGLILGREGIVKAYETGRGIITVRARAAIEEGKSGRAQIVVTELPYEVNKARLIERIAQLVREKKIDGISDLRDETDRTGLRVVVDVARGANPHVLLNQLYKHTQMQTNISIIMLALVDGQPRVLGLQRMVFYYLEHQKEVVTRRSRYELRKAEERAHILEGLRIALDNIDRIVALIRASQTPEDAREGLMAEFGLSDKQAQAILDMRLQRLTGLEREKIEEEYTELLKTIEYLRAILGSEHLLMSVIKKEIADIRKRFADGRRTQVVAETGDLNIEDLIADDDVVITLTHNGYVKRLLLDTYRTQNRGGRGVMAMSTRQEDFVEEIFVTTNHHWIMFFTNKGRAYRMKVHEIPEAGRTARGMAIVNLIPLDEGEKVTAVIPIRDFDDQHYLFMATRRGVVKKTSLDHFDTNRRGGLIATGLDEGDELIGVKLTDGSMDVLLTTQRGLAIRFKEDEVRPMGREARGVRGISLIGRDEVVGMEVLPEKGDPRKSYLLAVTEKGYGKRTPIGKYRVQGRGGKGIKTLRVTPRNGSVAAIKAVGPGDEVMLITANGVVIRQAVDGISAKGRDTQGVTLMRLDEGDSLVAVARVEARDEA